MTTTRRRLTPLKVLAVIAIVMLAALLFVGIFDLYERHFGRPPAERISGGLRPRSSSDRTAIPSKALVGFQSRITKIDTSGSGPLISMLKPWEPTDSLQSIAEQWKQPGLAAIAKLEPDLQAARQSGDAPRLFDVLMLRASFLNSEGDAKHAYETLDEARAVLKKQDSLEKYFLYTTVYFQGVTAMRRGENDNCVDCQGESSCILPISPAAVHSNPTGSRLAIRNFMDYLEQFPNDFEVRWLLNVAHMTLGEYPSKVDPRFLISLDRFTSSEFNIGKFRDVAHLVGVNRFNQAGGAVMDDFDNDGKLDLVVTSFDPTMPMAFYRNAGDGTFEDRSEPAGVTDQLGGLVCYQTDFNNDGRLDVFIPRGAWLPFPIRPSLLRNDGGGKFTDVTKEAGMLEATNSNAACWADYDNDGWLDVFVGSERQPHLLYHNRKDGTFEEVSAKAGLRDYPKPLFCKGATWIDFDNDGYSDLFLNNLGGTAELHHNNHDGTFRDVTTELKIDGPYHGFSCWTFDYDNDGWQDIFATCYDRTVEDVVKGLIGMPHTQYSNRLFRNINGEAFDNRTKEAGLDLVFSAMGSNYADFDNDGFLDMYLGTGEPSFGTLIPNRMFKNVDGNRFSEITGTAGTGHLQKGHGVACGDWDRDGDVDLFVQTGGFVNGDRFHDLLFQNPGQGNHWLAVKLIGQKTNRAAIRARIKVITSSDKPLTVQRHVSSGSSFGGNPLQQTIGLAQAKKVATLEIFWPTSKTTQVFHDIPADQTIEITEFATSFRRLDSAPLKRPE